MRCALDASITVSFVIADEFSSRSKRALAAVARDGAVVPSLWQFEVLNSLWSAERRGRISISDLTNAISGLDQLPIDVDSRAVDGLRLTARAREFGLSVSDASYLGLALDSNLPLATLDSQLARAATAAGVDLLK